LKQAQHRAVVATGPKLVNESEPRVELPEYPRITPGVYRGYSAVAKFHFDRFFGRWVCFVRWNVLSDDLARLIARIPLWWSLGSGTRPRASRRGKYLKEWVRANGGPPVRGDRLSPKVFRHRMARVEVGDTDSSRSPVPYSVVKKIIEWETGPVRGHSVSKSHSQGRHGLNPSETQSYQK
jgi:hypothetical protein